LDADFKKGGFKSQSLIDKKIDLSWDTYLEYLMTRAHSFGHFEKPVLLTARTFTS
jgi:hypothetical protein